MSQNPTNPSQISKVLDIGKEIEATRKKLLDLTMRNKLLNFFPQERLSQPFRVLYSAVVDCVGLV